MVDRGVDRDLDKRVFTISSSPRYLIEATGGTHFDLLPAELVVWGSGFSFIAL